jgi:predicted transcriptional regulator
MSSDGLADKLMDELTLLERHIKMLKVTKENQPIGIIRLSEILGLPMHKVRYSLHLLEKQGLISPSVDGAMVTDKYDEYMKETAEKMDLMISTIQNLKKEL